MPMSIAEGLKARMKAAGLSITATAAEARTTEACVYGWVSGRKEPKISSLLKLPRLYPDLMAALDVPREADPQ
ncbi:MAG: hypothetical protein NVS2B17_29140 [Candidatus Velthaea sp.]